MKKNLHARLGGVGPTKYKQQFSIHFNNFVKFNVSVTIYPREPCILFTETENSFISKKTGTHL